MAGDLIRNVKMRLVRRSHKKLEASLKEACPIPGGIMMWADGILMEPDHCHPLEDPTWVDGRSADHMRPDDPVLGIANDDGAWALPWWVMKNHHVANLDLAGQPRTVIFCEACATGGLYDPVIEGTRYRWAVTGMADGVTIMRDLQSGSLWNSLSMQPIHGPATALPRPTRLPLVQSRWSEWLAAHPDTLVAFEVESARRGHGAKHRSPDHRERRFRKTKSVKDDRRLDQLSLVLGVDTGTGRAAYPLDELDAAGGIVNDTVGDIDVVVVHRPGTWIATAFERMHDGTKLDLTWDGPHLVDNDTGGRWSELGMPVDGGEPLAYVRSGIEKWHAWSGIFPDARLYGHD